MHYEKYLINLSKHENIELTNKDNNSTKNLIINGIYNNQNLPNHNVNPQIQQMMQNFSNNSKNSFQFPYLRSINQYNLMPNNLNQKMMGKMYPYNNFQQ